MFNIFAKFSAKFRSNTQPPVYTLYRQIITSYSSVNWSMRLFEKQKEALRKRLGQRIKVPGPES